MKIQNMYYEHYQKKKKTKEGRINGSYRSPVFIFILTPSYISIDTPHSDTTTVPFYPGSFVQNETETIVYVQVFDTHFIMFIDL